MPNLETPTASPLAVVKLSRPLSHGSDSYTELKFPRRLKARDMFGIRIGGMKFDDYVTLISRAANVPAFILEDMDLADFTEACGVIDSFLSNGPATSNPV